MKKLSLSYIILGLMYRGCLRFLSDKAQIKLEYQIVCHKKLDLNHVRTFNEKIQWLKLYDRKDIYTTMVDKCDAKKYVANIIGDEYIIPTLGVYDSFDQIDFDSLPNKFVLKPTHTSGNVFVCHDKSLIKKNELKRIVNGWLKRNYYLCHREWPYKNIKPRIIAEEFLETDENDQLFDYKIMCFNGKAKCSFVCSDRNNGKGLKVSFFDREWNTMPFERHYPRSKETIEKPKNYEQMTILAEKLSQDIPFLRVDFYQHKDKILFGELTFYPGNGMEEFNPEEWDLKLGEWITLPKKESSGE